MNTYVKVENVRELNAVIALLGFDYVEHCLVQDVFYFEPLEKEQFVKILKYDSSLDEVAQEVSVPSTIYSFSEFMRDYKKILK